MKGGDSPKAAALDQTASMSPDERARRGLTPPTPPSGERAAAGAIDTPAMGETLAADSGPGAPVSIDIAALPVDATGRYELSGVHARGGLGRIVKARDNRLHRTVAIKELLQRTPATEARFVREALITARLEHPGIVPVHEAGRWPSGDPYYSMKLVSGRTLKELIQSGSSLEERLALVPHVLAVAEAIAYAHSQRIIHRDIKPANVIVGDFGETVVVDWGLAKDLSGQVPEAAEGGEAAPGAPGTPDRTVPARTRNRIIPDDPVGPTALGNIMGTPSYMSPEQARGEELDERADVFSLGAMLYELLVGEPPHTGDSAAQILDSALAGLPPPIERYQPHAPPDLVAIARKAMARSREARYPTAVELAEDIRRFQTGQLVTARSYSRRHRVARWVARHRGMVAVSAAAALALVAGGAYSFQRVVGEKNHALAEEASARAAENDARRQSDELVFQQARSSLAYDPTATLAWLKIYPVGGPHADQLGALIDEATSLGVARYVLRQPEWVMGAGYDRDGNLVSTDLDGRIVRWNLATGEGTVIAQHAQKVWSGRVSPDGTRMAVGGQEGLVGIYPLTGDSKPRQLAAKDLMVERLQFSADGQRLLTWNKGNQIQVWNVDTGDPLLTLDADVTCGAIHPDGQTAFVGLESGEIVRAGVDGSRSHVARFAQPTMLLYVSPAGDRLLAHGRDGTMRLVDLATGKARVLGSQPWDKGVATFSHRGDLVATGGVDAVIHVFSTLNDHRHDTLRGHDDAIYQVEFAPDDSYLASASDDGTARIWDLSSLQSQVLRGHEDDVNTLAIRKDGRELVTTSLDKSLRIWPVGHEERVLVGSPGVDIDKVGFSGDGERVFAVGKDRVVRAWELASGVLHTRQLPPVKNEKTMWPSADRALNRVAIPREDGAIDLWDVPSGKTRTLRGHEGPVSVVMSRDGSRMVSSDKRGTTLVWDLTGDQPSSRVMFANRPLSSMNLSANGEALVASEKGRIFSVDPASGQQLASIDLAAAGYASTEIYSLGISPDGRHVLGGGKKGGSLLWTVADGTLRSFGRPGYHINQAEFSLDSRWLAASMSDRTVILWNLATGRSTVLKGHRDLVFQVAFSRDGETLASASYDRTVRLWDAESGRPVRVLRGHSAPVQGVAFSPDGALLASGAADGTVRLWDMTALPSNRPDAVRTRLERATTARISDGHAATLTHVRD